MLKRITSVSGWNQKAACLSVFLMVALILVGCSQSPSPQPTEPTAAATATQAPPTATLPPAATATQAPTETPLPTATQPPTATPIPPLAVLSDGFNAWCASQRYAGSQPSGPDAPADARVMTNKNNQLQVQIPAAFCTLVVRFNQAVPDGSTLTFFDGKNPFLKLPLKPAEGHPEEAWASVTHGYVVNPPYWSVAYHLSVTGPDGKELWANSLTFAKPLPETCIYTNKLPDPVTGYCPITDPLEIEPHPDTVYPYDRSRLLTPHPGK
jgi:hypothetical protein